MVFRQSERNRKWRGMRRRDSHQQHLVVFFLNPLGFVGRQFVCVCVCVCTGVCMCSLAFQRVTLGIELHGSGSASATRESCQFPSPSWGWNQLKANTNTSTLVVCMCVEYMCVYIVCGHLLLVCVHVQTQGLICCFCQSLRWHCPCLVHYSLTSH